MSYGSDSSKETSALELANGNENKKNPIHGVFRGNFRDKKSERRGVEKQNESNVSMLCLEKVQSKGDELDALKIFVPIEKDFFQGERPTFRREVEGQKHQ